MLNFIPLPTDNLYKFICLFGLAMVLSGVIAFFTSYSSSLDQKVKLMSENISLSVTKQTKQESSEKIALNNRLIEVIDKNENIAAVAVGLLIGLGIFAVIFGGNKWYLKVQQPEDETAQLKLKKLRLEVDSIEIEPPHPQSETTT